MKFFAALIAKLTGTAEQPKTLDQARATFGEAKAALDKIAALFSTASIDLDALLAKGETALKDLLAELNGKVTAAESALTEANGKVTAAESKATEAEGKVTALNSQVAALEGLLASVGFKLEPGSKIDTTAFQAAFNAHIANGVTAKMAELGIKADKLPAASSADEANTEEELIAQLNATKDPVQKGIIGAKLNKLRDQARQAAHGKN